MDIPGDEFILRRIHKDHCDTAAPVFVLLAAFRPNKSDTTGLSVFREKEIAPEQVAASGRKPDEYFVARLHVQDLHAMQLSVVSEEIPDGPHGHAVIPELTYAAYGANKEGLKPLLLELARLASKEIVFVPHKG